MIVGQVATEREAVVQFRVTGPAGANTDIIAVVDTGFTGHLTLPQRIIEALGLPTFGSRTALLAGGQKVVLRVFEGSVEWDTENRPIQILEAEGSPLLGMAMLRGFRLTIDVMENGPVTIEKLGVQTGA
jgi:clan AA aspartic protease